MIKLNNNIIHAWSNTTDRICHLGDMHSKNYYVNYSESNLKLRTSPKHTADFNSHERISQLKVYAEVHSIVFNVKSFWPIPK